MASLSEPSHDIVKFPDEVRVFQLCGGRHYYYIMIHRSEQSLVQPVKLSYQSLASISCDGVSCFAACSYSDSGRRAFRHAAQ